MVYNIAFCSNQCNPYYSEVALGVTEFLQTSGEAELMSLKGLKRFPLQAISLLKPDGAIAGPVCLEESKTIFMDIPVVGISNVLEIKPFPSVINDDREVGRQAARAIMEAGYDRIVILDFGDNHFVRQRAAGVQEAAKDLQFPCQRLNVRLRKTSKGEVFHDVWAEYQSQLKTQMKSIPKNTGIVALEPRIAIELLALQSEIVHLKIPEEVGLVLADLPEPEMKGTAYVSLAVEEIGKKAAELLIAKLKNPATNLPAETLVPPKGVIWGETLRHATKKNVKR
ncbi:MAG: substrate-binding domain-containing protein [Verrucomicrobia bacterium]|nr:substrate-binding domain-containing protein [Verrucomicrobiota bacterium]MCH8511092.1 substrate-binding domain-containing protein [Kiritimatiellia bacterium]